MKLKHFIGWCMVLIPTVTVLVFVTRNNPEALLIAIVPALILTCALFGIALIDSK